MNVLVSRASEAGMNGVAGWYKPQQRGLGQNSKMVLLKDRSESRLPKPISERNNLAKSDFISKWIPEE